MASTPFSFMGVELRPATRQELQEAIAQASPKAPVRIATPNPEFMVEAERNPAFRTALTKMTHHSLDGSGLIALLVLAAKWGRIPTQSLELYHGADLVADLFDRYQDGSRSFFLLGGPPGLAETAARHITHRYPHLRIVGATDGGVIDIHHPQVSEDIRQQLLATQPDILLVGFGAPKQELWIQAARDLPIPVMIGVGGTFGFYGMKSRAPQGVRRLHLEWLYRSLTERGHSKRAWQAVVVFPIHAFRWIIRSEHAQ